ncbi:Peptidase C19 ubiquitin carboxyl-terminal hydrolase 2 [Penicillium frequentans]|nr:Peptidase C19 ubiquitin carboxyl-terminal hydrolase 2 [Penicillium glabrum]
MAIARFAGNPDWPAGLAAATHIGFVNKGTDCYQIVTFQMLLHLPAFLNWLDYYHDQHVEGKKGCKTGVMTLACKLCHIRNLYHSCWNGEGSHQTSFDNLANTILFDWNKKYGEHKGQQDAAEFWTEVYEQFLGDMMDILQIDLASLFRLFTVTNRVCVGENACKAKWLQSEHDMLRVQFPVEAGDTTQLALHKVIQQWFKKRDVGLKCNECMNDRFDKDYFQQTPECLIVHLNRIKLDSEGHSSKIKSRILMSEVLQLDGVCFDPNIVAPEEKVYYELTSVIMHTGSSPNLGHYYIFAKGPGGKWARIDDENIQRFNTFEEWATRSKAATDAYIFAYRRITEDEYQQVKLKEKKKKGSKATKARKVQDQGVQTDEEVPPEPIEKEEEPMKLFGHPSTFRLKFTPAGGLPVVVNGEIETGDPMDMVGFPDTKGLLELTWVDEKNNILRDLNIQGELRNVIGRKTGKTTQEGRKSRFKEHFSGSGSGSNKSKKSASSEKPTTGAKPTGIVKKRSAKKSALEHLSGLKRALGGGDKGKKEEKDEKKKQKEKKKQEKENKQKKGEKKKK